MTEYITWHHDGHGLNESIAVKAVDDFGPGGAYHHYVIDMLDSGDNVGFLQFQKGPRNEPDSTPRLTEGAVLAVVLDRLLCFQLGPYPSDENEEAITHLTAALAAIKRRADNRAERGVLGTYNK